MSGEKQVYLVRRVADGTMRSILAQSARGAIRTLVDKYNPPAGEEYGVKLRGAGDWEFYRV